MALFKKKAVEAEAPMDVDAVMKKYDRESNVRVWEGVPKIIVNCILAAFSLFCIYVTFFATWLDYIRLASFVGSIIFIGFLVFPARKGTQKTNYIPWYDFILMAVGSGSFFYIVVYAEKIINQGIKFENYQIIIAAVGVLCLLELCRRCVGIPIILVAVAFMIYALFFGLQQPDFMRRIVKLFSGIFYTTSTGVLSTPIDTCSKYIAIFIIFGAFLERTGIADFFIKIANSVVGGFSGGPAKVAVVASALEGMVSGSSVANTVGSGAVTIPLMKKAGYKPEFAAAAEAAASTGGQIMPPIMGAAAFLMAENLGISYSNIVVRAILPAVLYFLGVFIVVHLEAKKEGLRGLTKDELPKLLPLLKQAYLLLPIILLIGLVSSGARSIAFAAAVAIIASIVVGLFNKENRITPKRIFEALAAGGQGMITVAVACGVAGIIAGIISITGLATQLMTAIVGLAGNQVIVALFLTMIACIILGMGVPTTANYCIMAATCAPILMEMGVPDIAAHFFVFYFGIVADLTPPVALAAYAGAAIAQANPMKTAITATKLAIGAFIVPYIFALNPAMLFVNTVWHEVVLICISAIIGMFGVSAALEGYLLARLKWYERIVAAVGGLLLIYPGWKTDLIGLCLVGMIFAAQWFANSKHKNRDKSTAVATKTAFGYKVAVAVLCVVCVVISAVSIISTNNLNSKIKGQNATIDELNSTIAKQEDEIGTLKDNLSEGLEINAVTAQDIIAKLESGELQVNNKEELLEQLKSVYGDSTTQPVIFKSYTVVSGDNLISICEKFEIDYYANKDIIMALNGIDNSAVIRVNQVLIIPVK